MSKKKYFIVIALIAMIAVFIAGIYAIQQSQKLTIGVKTGDIFTYKMTGTADVPTADVPIPENFMDINNVEYYRIEITNVDFPIVSYIETTQFKNGTSLTYTGAINVKNGINTGEGGFWGIFVAGLKKNSLSRPEITDGLAIEDTETRTYLDGDRKTNWFHAETTLYDVDDETLSRECLVYTYIYFDQQTGILVELKDLKMYNDPQIILTVEWKLIDSNVLQVT
jgi:hypothetical protein